jgi:hypothetical protein
MATFVLVMEADAGGHRQDQEGAQEELGPVWRVVVGEPHKQAKKEDGQEQATMP